VTGDEPLHGGGGCGIVMKEASERAGERVSGVVSEWVARTSAVSGVDSGTRSTKGVGRLDFQHAVLSVADRAASR